MKLFGFLKSADRSQHVDGKFLASTVTASDVSRRYQRPYRDVEILRRVIACSVARTYVNNNSWMLSQFTPRMFKRGRAPSKFVGVKQCPVNDRKTCSAIVNPCVSGKGALFASRSEDVNEVTSHPFLTWLRQPNPIETGGLFWQKGFVNYEIFGKQFFNFVMGSGGVPVEAWRCYPQYTTVVPSKSGLIEGYRYEVPGASGPTMFGFDEIAYLRIFQSDINLYDSESWPVSVVAEMEALTYCIAAEVARFENGCRPDFAVMAPKLAPAQAEQLKAKIVSQHRGVQNAGSFLVLAGAEGIEPLQWNSKEIGTTEFVQRCERRIRQAAGVTEAQADLNSSNLASSAYADTQYMRQKVQPILRLHAEQLTDVLINWWGESEGEYWISYDDVVPSDVSDNRDQAVSLWSSGIANLNEARTAIGLNSIVGGDVFVGGAVGGVPTPAGSGGALQDQAMTEDSAAPIAFDGAQAQAVSAIVASVANGEVPRDSGVAQLEVLFNLTNEQAERIVGSSGTREFVPATRDGGAASASGKSRKCDCESCGKSHTKSAAGGGYLSESDAFDKLKSSIVDWITLCANKREYDQAAFESAVKVPLGDAFLVGMQQGVSMLEAASIEAGAGFDVIPENALRFLDTYTVRLAKQLTDERNESLKSEIASAVASGETLKEATDRVWSDLKDRTVDDAERIARTEMSEVLQQGNLMSWKEVGVEKKQFLPSAGACEICLEVAKRNPDPIPIDRPYVKLGTVMEVGGKIITFSYKDVVTANVHPNCGCISLPVSGDE